MTKINRPVIFICNNPYVKGLKELRGKAHIFFFNTLLEERVFKRLREIVNNEGIFIENEALRRICAMCKNDIRSAVGVL